MLKKLSILALFCLLVLSARPADAHKIFASAWTDGADIEGEIGMSNGEMAQPNIVVEVFDGEGNKLGETQVKEEGLFRFTPTKAVEHHFKANLGAGHVATVVVGLDELPENLRKGSPEIQNTASPAPSSKTPAVQPLSTDVQKLVAKAVRQEVQPLRKEIASYKEKNDMQSILGGIGYILGLTGIGFYVAARRDMKKNA